MPGFTLLELICVLVMISILSIMVYPHYVHYETDAARVQAEASLTILAARIEDYFSVHGSYEHVDEINMSDLTKNLHYALVIPNHSSQHFELQAIPDEVQSRRDYHCGTLILEDTNEKKISGDGNMARCWG